MRTSQTFSLSKPTGADRVSDDLLGYFRQRNRNHAHALVLSEFVRSGVTRADLARRLGKRPEQVTRMLGAAGNWTLDTISDFLFALSGAEPVYGVNYPLDQPRRNFRLPVWISSDELATTTTSSSIAHTITAPSARILPDAIKSANDASLEHAN